MDFTEFTLAFFRIIFSTPFILSIILLIALYKWSTAKFDVLNERKVPHPKPKPFFGNFRMDVLFGQTSFMETFIDLHLRFKNSKVYGMYFMRHPMIMIRDIALIKRVIITDFHNFTNHQSNTKAVDNDLGRNLYILKDQEWKEMRHILAPTFTDMKMRAIFELINECCIEGINYLDQKLKENDNKGLEFKMHDIFSYFTNDVTLSAALGIKVISFRHKENSFFTIGSTVMNFGGITLFKATLMQMMPKLMKICGLKVFNTSKIEHFNNVVLSAIKYREQHNIVRPDMIHLLTEAKKNISAKLARNEKCYEFNDKDLLAQCLLFFCAGFGKVRFSLCSTAYELMVNPLVQDQLYQEILEVQKRLDGKPLNYDMLINMRYLDMVVSESLRKWPSCSFTNRVCNQDYDLKDDNGNTVIKLKKDDNICIPIIGLHRDPVHFENPEMFDPERFSEENRESITPFTYIPFGGGPRICIGNHLALIEIKVVLFHMILRYRIECGSRTENSLFNTMRVFQNSTDKLWLKLLPRS